MDSKTEKARCHEEGDPTSLWCDTRASCLQLGSPCLLAKVKENWETARLPLKDNDDHLFRVLEKVKSGYGKVGEETWPDSGRYCIVEENYCQFGASRLGEEDS